MDRGPGRRDTLLSSFALFNGAGYDGSVERSALVGARRAATLLGQFKLAQSENWIHLENRHIKARRPASGRSRRRPRLSSASPLPRGVSPRELRAERRRFETSAAAFESGERASVAPADASVAPPSPSARAPAAGRPMRARPTDLTARVRPPSPRWRWT